MVRLLTSVSIAFALAACDRSYENCAKIEPGMGISQVIEIMGEPRDSYLTGHPPDGLMLLYGRGKLSEWPHQPGGPIGIALNDAPWPAVAGRTVGKTYCGSR